MGWKNQLTKTPYLVLFIILITVGVGTASALITITLSGDVIITGFLDMTGDKITDVGSPTVSTDAATKGYVDSSPGTDTLALLGCTSSQIPKWDGSNWICSIDNTEWNSSIPSDNAITTVESIGDNVGEHPSVTIGVDGLPVISYYDVTNGDLKVAKCTNTSCTSSTITAVDSTGDDVGEYTSIAIGVDGNPVISYWDRTNEDLKVAKCTNASCTSSTITAVDSTGDDVGRDTSITIGVDGNPVISYYDETTGDLKLAYCTNASCTSSTTTAVDSTGDDVGQESSVTIGVVGFPLISYYDVTNGDLKLAYCHNASCTSSTPTTVDSDIDDVGRHTSITIGEDGFPVISYYDDTNGNLKLARCGPQTCTSSTITTVDSTGDDVGRESSVTIGIDGLPVISYHDDSPNWDLKVVHCVNISCTASTTTTVDSTGMVGTFTSITIGVDGNPVISYYDDTTGDLKVAKCANPFCISNWTRR